jgi:hypothetical protein
LVTACQVNDIVVVYAYSYSVGAYSGIGGSGTATQVAYFTSSAAISSSSNLYWNNTNGRLGINQGTPLYSLDVTGKGRFTDAVTIGTDFAQLLPITASNYQLLVGAYYDGTNIIATATSGSRTVYNVGNITFNTFSGATVGSSVTDTSRMIIASTGVVGIGTISPQTTLEINAGSTYFPAKILTLSGAESTRYNGFIGLNLIAGSQIGMTFGTRSNNTDYANTLNLYNGNVSINVTPDANFQFYVKGIDSTSSNYAIVIRNSGLTNLFFIRNDGAIFTGTASTSPYNNTTGTAANLIVLSDGSLARSTSSLKYKNNVENYTKGLAEVMQLRPVSYEGKNDIDNGKQFAGLIAEEVHDLGLNEFVQYAEDGSPDALAYSNMVALLVKAIQELSKELSTLKAIVATK